MCKHLDVEIINIECSDIDSEGNEICVNDREYIYRCRDCFAKFENFKDIEKNLTTDLSFYI